ncbi:TolC family protein [Marinomonas sp.]|uniref:TolC family protein n=1 Tax=Marinomonas sp. TaxID=1904862 RepID=UPI003C763267
MVNNLFLAFLRPFQDAERPHVFTKTFNRSVCVLALSMTSFVVDAETLSLQTVISKAVSQDEWLTANQAKEAAIRSLSGGMTALPDPKISLGLSNLPTDTGDFHQEAMTQVNLSVSQVFPAGDTLSLIGEKYAAQGDQMPLLRENRQAIITMTVSDLWLTAYKFEQSIALVQHSKRLFEQLNEEVEGRYRSAYGQEKQQDLVRATLAIHNLDLRLTKLNQAKQNALTKLTQYLDPSLVPESIQLATDKLPLASLWANSHLIVQSLNASSLDQLAARLSQHPLVRLVDVQSSTAKIEKSIAEQKYKPEWGVTLGYGYRSDDLNGKTRSDLASVAVSVSMPIFSTRRQDAQVKAASLEVASLVSEKALVLNDLLAKYRSLTSDIRLLDQQISLYQHQLIPSYQASAQSMLHAYTNNDGRFSEVLQARIDTLNAHVERLNIEVERAKRLSQLAYVLTTKEEVIAK